MKSFISLRLWRFSPGHGRLRSSERKATGLQVSWRRFTSESKWCIQCIQTWPQISTAKTIKAAGSKSTDHFLKFYILKHFWNMKLKFHNKHFGGRAEPQNLMTEWAKGHWRLRLTLMARLGFLEFLGEFLGCWFSAFLHRLAAFVFPAEFGGSNCDITAFLNSLPNTSMWIFTLR